MIDSADPYIFILLVVLFLSREHITWVWFHTLSSTWFFFLSPAFDVGKREVGRNSSDPRHQAARRTLPDPPIESLDRGCLLPHERGSPFRVANVCCLDDGCNFRLNGPLFAYWISVDIDPVNELHSALFFSSRKHHRKSPKPGWRSLRHYGKLHLSREAHRTAASCRARMFVPWHGYPGPSTLEIAKIARI